MINKTQVIHYLMSLKDDYQLKLEDIIYDDITKSLTFKELQEIDHLRTNMNKIYEIINFIDKEGN